MIRSLKPILFSLLLLSIVHSVSSQTDSDLARLFPEFPNISIFRDEYLEFFADDPDHERSRRNSEVGTYILPGDFDNDGIRDLAISGLIDIEPVEGVYYGFVAILQDAESGYSTKFFQKLIKPAASDTTTMQNIVLFAREDGTIAVDFKFETDFTATIEYHNGVYSICLD